MAVLPPENHLFDLQKRVFQSHLFLQGSPQPLPVSLIARGVQHLAAAALSLERDRVPGRCNQFRP